MPTTFFLAILTTLICCEKIKISNEQMNVDCQLSWQIQHSTQAHPPAPPKLIFYLCLLTTKQQKQTFSLPITLHTYSKVKWWKTPQIQQLWNNFFGYFHSNHQNKKEKKKHLVPPICFFFPTSPQEKTNQMESFNKGSSSIIIILLHTPEHTFQFLFFFCCCKLDNVYKTFFCWQFLFLWLFSWHFWH